MSKEGVSESHQVPHPIMVSDPEPSMAPTYASHRPLSFRPRWLPSAVTPPALQILSPETGRLALKAWGRVTQKCCLPLSAGLAVGHTPGPSVCTRRYL